VLGCCYSCRQKKIDDEKDEQFVVTMFQLVDNMVCRVHGGSGPCKQPNVVSVSQ